ncbi:hypothetical protein [Actinoallomurus iriomotensis]|uniref:Uncharacterized protein n=1 Tax=Actinoallomurus iriomotensis TaxID=478107 RepID=A0A9W6RER5_9ACTN|nr:hypothetical protein [Actinoallomurus iriomotensis]GLY74458.1 hypothetical protein Airi01_027250 [Actinoallomurus iriomotensis]
MRQETLEEIHESGYLQATPIPVGGALSLPAPFEITLDTTTMPRRKH